MRPDTLPLLSLVKAKLSHLGARQRVIAENIANAPTPKYVPRAVAPMDFRKLVAGEGAHATGLKRTHSGHMSSSSNTSAAMGGRVKIINSPDTETTLDGNAVVLEEQMVRLSEVRMQYDAAIGIYQKSMTLMRMALRKPGA